MLVAFVCETSVDHAAPYHYSLRTEDGPGRCTMTVCVAENGQIAGCPSLVSLQACLRHLSLKRSGWTVRWLWNLSEATIAGTRHRQKHPLPIYCLYHFQKEKIIHTSSGSRKEILISRRIYSGFCNVDAHLIKMVNREHFFLSNTKKKNIQHVIHP